MHTQVSWASYRAWENKDPLTCRRGTVFWDWGEQKIDSSKTKLTMYVYNVYVKSSQDNICECRHFSFGIVNTTTFLLGIFHPRLNRRNFHRWPLPFLFWSFRFCICWLWLSFAPSLRWVGFRWVFTTEKQTAIGYRFFRQLHFWICGKWETHEKPRKPCEFRCGDWRTFDLPIWGLYQLPPKKQQLVLRLCALAA